jgi:quinoprotein glucose dehydrogenase
MFTRADLTDVSPESKRYCEDLFNQLSTSGRYTPYGTKLTLVYPGTLGGATWSGVSFDPSLRYLFVNTNEAGVIGQMIKQPEGSPMAYRRTSANGEYARFWDENMWLCQRPPWDC